MLTTNSIKRLNFFVSSGNKGGGKYTDNERTDNFFLGLTRN